MMLLLSRARNRLTHYSWVAFDTRDTQLRGVGFVRKSGAAARFDR